MTGETETYDHEQGYASQDGDELSSEKLNLYNT